jgi:hypothetical protein
MKNVSIIGLGAALLTLSACGGNSDGGDKGATEASAVEVALTKSGAPKRADGYWELKHIGSGGTMIGTQFLCIGGDAEERGTVFDGIAIKNSNCGKYEIKRNGAAWDFAFVCGAAPMLAETSGKVSGDFTYRYTIKMQAKEGDLSQSRTIEARNGGACPAGVAVGDLMDEQGKKVTNTLN